MKVIFLDVDGVLNYIGCRTRYEHFYFVDDLRVRYLAWLQARTGAQLVLSSSWKDEWRKDGRKTGALKKLCEKLSDYHLTLLDRTPDAPDGRRGEEIRLWLQNWRGEPVEKFVILDDGDDMAPFMDRLVQTSFEEGLTLSLADRARMLLR